MVLRSPMSIFSGLIRRRASPKSTMGVSGTPIFGGFIQSIEKDSSLVGTQRYTTFSDILANTSIVAAGVRYFLNLISKPTWSVEPADDSGPALEAAEFVEDIMSQMDTPWFRVVRRAGMFKFYGFSFQEWTAQRRVDGRIGMLDVAPRPQLTIEQWEVDNTGVVLGVGQRSPQTQQLLFLPRTKLIYVVDDSLSDSPEGLGLFRHLVKPAKQLKVYEELEGAGYEADIRGVPIGKAPFAELDALVRAGTIKEEDRQNILQPMKDFIQNHIRGPKLGLLIDSLPYEGKDAEATPSSIPQWDLDILKGTTVGQEPLNFAIQRLNFEMARVIGVEGLLLGSDGKGSLALSRDKTHNFYLIVDSGLRELVEVFGKDFIGPIWRLNGLDELLKPKFKTEVIQFRDVEQITSSLKDMAQAGAVLEPGDPAVAELRRLLGLSPPLIVKTEGDASLIGDEEEVEDKDVDDVMGEEDD